MIAFYILAFPLVVPLARAYGEHAIVVTNLLREGTSANAAADRKYTQHVRGAIDPTIDQTRRST